MKNFVIAEISGNHCNSKYILKKTIAGCSKAGANAFKMQYYKAKNLVPKVKNDIYKSGIWKGKLPHEVLKNSETNLNLIKYGIKLSKKHKMEFICSVFEAGDILKLKKIGVKNFKIASLEANYLDLIKTIRKFKEIFFISLGAINLKKLNIFKKYFNFKKNIFFYCKVKYPSKLSDYDLNKIRFLKKKLEMLESQITH